MPNTREKLIALLDEACPRPYCSVPDMNCDICDYNHPKWHCVDLRVADYLIANGVKIPVLCKECKSWEPSGSMAGNSEDDLQPIGGCKWANCVRKANDFCSFGERKSDHGSA